MHARFLSGQQRPMRSLVSIAVESGTADRLLGLVSLFYYALVTDRAFFHQTYGVTPGWEAAYDSPWINSTGTFADSAITPLKSTYLGVRNYRGARNYDELRRTEGAEVASLYAPLWLVNEDDGTEAAFVYQDPNDPNSSPLARVPNIVAASNRGRTHDMFRNAAIAPRLTRMGLTPTTAFGCGLRFLFSLKPSACDRTCGKIRDDITAAADAGSLIIGVMVRVGDEVFKPEVDAQTALSVASNHFACVAQIEETRRREGAPPPVIYFTSDSLRLRQLAKAAYGDRLLTDTEWVGVHPDCGHLNPWACNAANAALAAAAAQMSLLALADVHVVTGKSGFGVMSAWASPLHYTNETAARSRAHLYRVYDGPPRDCSVAGADVPAVVATTPVTANI